jgi:hypothetical protein
VVADHTPLERGSNALAPPLQPNLAEHRLADGFADSSNLIVKRVERKQRFAALGRSE